MKLAVLAAALLVGQGQIFYQDLDGTLRVSNVKEGEGGSAKGVFSFDVIGSPLVVVEKLEVGLKVTAPKIDGKLATSADPTRQLSYIRELHTHNGTVATIDSKAAEDASIDLAKRRGTPPPKRAESHSVSEFRTDRLDYSGTEEKGKFTIPGAFTLNSKAEGLMHMKAENQTIDKRFTQTIDAKGVFGTFNLDPSVQKEQVPLQSGTVEGPMTFELVRSETTVGTNQVEVSKFSGAADRAVIDLEKERTITFSGHVKVRGENSALIGTSEGDTVILYLDETLNVIRVKILGEPAKSTAREKKGGGEKK